MAISIQVQNTPNPNSVKINTDQTIFEGPSSTSLKNGDATDHPLAAALLSIEGVDNIFGIRDFVTISKTADAEWDTILPQVEQAFVSVYN
ncbi:NifU N-terminal domain-containing protein [Paenibacillus albidus]|uniref:NifU N-terminal domain-containing protein n=1 Tax=Paenibacillus albidus TaxID=2041023 RepID=UPI001BE841E5|nr:NifU N-terminal domain-containing protein [Paenibacillus albidus]MBT2292105.1 NifU N-terminal domain-containing protein [Paenibacillus albidus]